MTTYVLWRTSAGAVLQPLFALAVLAAWRVFTSAPWSFMVLAGVVVIVSSAVRARAMCTLLRVDSRGITLSGQPRQEAVYVPWASVREVVVVTDMAAEPRVGVRLRPGAPLPDGVPGIVQDPANTGRVAPSLVRTAPRLDRAAARRRSGGP